MNTSARDYVIRTSAEAQRRARDADEMSARVSVEAPRPAETGSSARESVEEAAVAVYRRASGAGTAAAGFAADRMAEVAELADSLATKSASLEDREEGERILREIAESVDRIKASYAEDASMVREYAGDAIREHAESALATREYMALRADEVRRARDFLVGATGELYERFMAEADRRGLREVVDRAVRALDFASRVDSRVGGVPAYASDLAAPIDDLEARLAERASVPGDYEKIGEDVEGVLSRDKIDSLLRRVDSLG